MSHKDVCFPQTFSLSIEKIIMQNLEGNPGIKVGGLNLNNLRHSDDTVLMPANKEDLQQLLDIVEEESRKKGLELNSKSTVEAMSVHRPTSLLMWINSSRGINSNSISSDGHNYTEIASRIVQAKKEFPENEINTNKKTHLDSHKKKSPVVLCWTHSDVWMRGLDNFKTVKKRNYRQKKCVL